MEKAEKTDRIVVTEKEKLMNAPGMKLERRL